MSTVVSMAGLKKDHNCGELRITDCGKQITVMGWVQRRRDHGGLIFIDLRDRFGLLQVVFNPESGAETFSLAESVRNEYVLAITGVVGARPKGTVNSNLATGEVEVYATELRILNKAKTPPFYIEDNLEADEMVRLKYRYLDLRRPVMQQALILRHKIAFAMREFLNQRDFLEVETPILTKSSPEGARDYLVPSRVHPGEFYALPQSPQLFKQMLMVSGIEKYFQVARCFRDEDLRADRQPEFTQLDIEMSFVDREDILALMEEMMVYIFAKTMNTTIKTPFARLTYAEAMGVYGSDKPDLRFGLKLVDIGEVAAQSNFKVFASVVNNGGQVKGINAVGCAKYSRKEIDELTNFVAIFGAKGLAYIQMTEEGPKSPIAKFFTPEQLTAICQKMNAKTGDLLMFVADEPMVVAESLGHLRVEIAKREGLIDPEEFNFCWVVDFPLFEYNTDEKRWVAMHHPFTSPMDEDVKYLLSDPGKAKAKAYDMVLNGVELGGGSIRIYDKKVQEQMFAAISMDPAEARGKFGYLLDAFEYGAPPHGGIAFGLDRMTMLLAKKNTIRDVIAFPKTQSATCAMMQAPSLVDAKQLRELYIKTTVPEK